jgi:hypothetical protein
LAASNEEFKELRLQLRRLPAHEAPADLIHSLRRDFVGPTWRERFAGWFRGAGVWRPITALAMVALVAGALITKQQAAKQDALDIQPLVAAHARYEGESMVPAGDLAGSGFGFQLASYYGEDN